MFGENKKWSERSIKPKPCKECGKIFNPSCGGNKYCTSCVEEVKRRNHAKNQAAWKAKNPDLHYKQKADWDLKTNYGIDYNTYLSIEQEQSGACAICGNTEPGGRGKLRKFAVDHNHETGAVRGLLCHHCNTAIGLFKEDISIIKIAIEYLEKHNE